MKTRAISNFLSQDEMDLIATFNKSSMTRFHAYDGRIRTMPSRLNTDKLQELYIKKHSNWENAVKAQVANTSSTYLSMLRNSDRVNPCAIENFLKSLMHLIQQGKIPSEQVNILQILEKDLSECGYSCPCPAEL